MIAWLGEIFGLGKVAIETAKPVVDKSIAEGPLKGNQERALEYEKIMSLSPNLRARELNDYMRNLFAEAGIARGYVSSETISIPVSDHAISVALISRLIMLQQLDASDEFKDNKT